MSDSEHASTNRRRYFRIDDHIGLEYEILTSEQFSEQIKILKIEELTPPEPSLNDSPMEVIQKEIKIGIKRLQGRNPTLASVLVGLNRKIDLLHMEMKMPDKKDMERTHVNLSACGMAFEQKDDLSQGTLLKMTLTLFPSLETFNIYGSVITSSEFEAGFRISVNYDYISSDNQELLIQYILQRQHLALRDQLEEEN